MRVLTGPVILIVGPEEEMNDQTEWVILDTETDGLYYPIHVVEIAAQRMRGLEPDGEPFQVFINHDVPIPPEAFAIHGYTREFLAENGVPPHDGHSRLRDYIGSRLVSSHYLSFDWNRVLVPEWARLGAASCGRKGMCTWLLSRRTIHETPTHRLDFLRDHFSLKCSRSHSAKGDVESTVDLLERVILPRLCGVGITSYESVQDFSRLRPVARCLCVVQGKDYEAEMREARARDALLNAELSKLKGLAAACAATSPLSRNRLPLRTQACYGEAGFDSAPHSATRQ